MRRAFPGLLAVVALLAAPVPVDSADHRMIVSDGIPDHAHGPFPGYRNPNRVQRQDYRFAIPMAPLRAAATTPLPMGPIGVAVNGIPFYNPYNAERQNAVEGPHAEVFDACSGHPDMMGRYHYHQTPNCVLRARPGLERGGVVGWAFDGYEIRGPLEADGAAPQGLDECNGHAGADGSYHYHLTPRFPYVLGCYRGVAARQNFDRGGRHPDRPPGMGPAAPEHRPPPGPGMEPPERRVSLDEELSNPPVCRSGETG